ncbi:translation initiation factor 3 RNA-binding subunit [Cantharellus anzutake]|uniref:translation initiation factor 3 RNA-binding subunit n=1 Tax=Cantharellus anzutake TaxID=1750568 RepID=UPI00190848E6|nr:translation initiation factor 3 RNA-binding subunit [Cantharellus anzutake]KAF8329503.1 translation initiation factor 3 RNA-binding subunit [Cantharellus anzutake]
MSAAVDSNPPKQSWADEVEDFDDLKPLDTIDANGIRTIVEYVTNEAGKKVKVTRKIRRTLQTSLVDHVVAERKQWAKFGEDKGRKAGLDKATTTVAERVELKLSAGNKAAEQEPDEEANIKKQLSGKKIMCRLCQGAHFTSKCPHKDVLAPLGGDAADLGTGHDDDSPADAGRAAPASSGKYIPPSMRAGAGRGAGETMNRSSRDDLPTLRVTNVSEDAAEDDLRELFSTFGRVARVFIGRDRDTGIGKGFAFVSFEDRAHAQKALEKMNGYGYDSLILSVQWSQPRESRPGP